MTLEKELNKLHPYLIGIRYLEGLTVIDTLFKPGWVFPESKNIKRINGTDDTNYYMIFSEDPSIGLDALIDYVESIINLNIEREKKHILLKETVEKLKIIFKNNTLAKLNTLRINFSDDVESIDDFNLESVPDTNDTPVEPIVDESQIPKTQVIQNVELTEEEIEIQEEEKRASNYRKLKNSNGKKTQLLSQVVQDSNTSTAYTECECGEDEACSKCISTKDL